VGDTCSGCHLAALKQSIGRVDHEVIFASFHVDVAETPFFVAIDYDHQSVVVSIRGTISMKVLGDRSMKDINQILNLSVFWVP
jgi:sn1-specific diacylglycerol lipase